MRTSIEWNHLSLTEQGHVVPSGLTRATETIRQKYPEAELGDWFPLFVTGGAAMVFALSVIKVDWWWAPGGSETTAGPGLP